MPVTITQGFLDAPVFGLVSDVAARLGVRAFVIGGYVRDCFLGRENDDIDIVVEGSGIDLAEAVSGKIDENARKYPAEKSRGNSRKYTEL
jgi:poly(A) polymerase